jgi:hypothetical protein
MMAGLIVAFRAPNWAYLVAIWLIGNYRQSFADFSVYFDVALRDLGLCLGALGRLRQEFDR